MPGDGKYNNKYEMLLLFEKEFDGERGKMKVDVRGEGRRWKRMSLKKIIVQEVLLDSFGLAAGSFHAHSKLSPTVLSSSA